MDLIQLIIRLKSVGVNTKIESDPISPKIRLEFYSTDYKNITHGYVIYRSFSDFSGISELPIDDLYYEIMDTLRIVCR